jgi:hypothetical protein
MLSVLHVGLESVEFVFGMSCVSVMQDRPLKSPRPLPHWTPYSIPLHTALRRFANPFRVASFGRADLTKFPWISPVTCEGDTALMLAEEFSPVSPFNAQQLIFKGYQRY